jgi:uncharacterized repeat protein (TIGR01451 family)
MNRRLWPSGTTTGVQPQTAGPVVARAGTTFTFTETAAGTTTLANYGIGEWQCVDQAANDVEVASGTGRRFTFTPAAGQAILCTFTNRFPACPGIDVAKTGRLDTGANGVANVGDTIDYTITVRNTGNVTLRNVTVTERDLAAMSAIDCGGGTNVIATLAAGASVNCTATHAVTQADLDAGFVPNFAVASGTPVLPGPPAVVDDVEDGDNDIEPIVAAIALQKTATPSVAARGSTVRFALRVTNRSEVAARDVRVCDQQPRGFTVAAAPGFRVRGRTVCRSIGTLQPGNRRTVVFTARVGATAPSRVTNTATATASNARSVQARARVSILSARPPRVTG